MGCRKSIFIVLIFFLHLFFFLLFLYCYLRGPIFQVLGRLTTSTFSPNTSRSLSCREGMKLLAPRGPHDYF